MALLMSNSQTTILTRVEPVTIKLTGLEEDCLVTGYPAKYHALKLPVTEPDSPVTGYRAKLR